MFLKRLSILVVLVSLSSPSYAWAQSTETSLQEILSKKSVQGIPLAFPLLLKKFYEDRAYTLAWIDNQKLKKPAKSFVKILQDIDQEGLKPDTYHFSALQDLLKNTPPSVSPSERLAGLDILFTDAYFIYATHFSGRRHVSEENKLYWRVGQAPLRPHFLLEDALKSGDMALAPQTADYEGLKKSLAAYRKILDQSGWKSIPKGPKMQKGDVGERVSLLRQRLNKTGELKSGDGNDYDDLLEKAVKNFQKTHGLVDDGKVGPETLASLNVSARHRTRQILVNLERARWQPRLLGERFIYVNIPEFQLRAIDHGRTALMMNVVAGLPKDWESPPLSGRITHLILNPKWHVPTAIIEDEILAKIQEDPEYLKKEKMTVYTGEGSETQEMDPSQIDWKAVDAKNLRIVQAEGEGNALGHLKFMFYNPFHIYLHDTSQQESFNQRVRAVSHGCIRVQRPDDLAGFALEGDKDWSMERFQKELKNEKTQSVRLQNPLPVHIVYRTTWVDSEGQLQFRPDIYKKDNPLAQALGM